MFDPHAIARALTDAGISPGHADAITDAVRLAAGHERADCATRADLAATEARMCRAMRIQASAIVGAVIGILRFLD